MFRGLLRHVLRHCTNRHGLHVIRELLKEYKKVFLILVWVKKPNCLNCVIWRAVIYSYDSGPSPSLVIITADIDNTTADTSDCSSSSGGTDGSPTDPCVGTGYSVVFLIQRYPTPTNTGSLDPVDSNYFSFLNQVDDRRRPTPRDPVFVCERIRAEVSPGVRLVRLGTWSPSNWKGESLKTGPSVPKD